MTQLTLWSDDELLWLRTEAEIGRVSASDTERSGVTREGGSPFRSGAERPELRPVVFAEHDGRLFHVVTESLPVLLARLAAQRNVSMSVRWRARKPVRRGVPAWNVWIDCDSIDAQAVLPHLVCE